MDKSPREQVYVESHHEEVQGRELRGHGNYEWNTDLIETKKLENYCTGLVVEWRNTNHEELTKNNTADLFTKH